MPEPNERQIEKLLKSAGAKRRGEAGTPVMHPSTREVLQTEVRRQYGAEPGRSPRGFSGLLRWLPRVAVLVALGACAWLLWFRDAGVDPVHLAMTREAASPVIPEKEAAVDVQEISMTAMVPAEIELETVGGKKLEPVTAAPAAPQLSSTAPDARLVRSVAPDQEAPKSIVGGDYLKSDRQAIYMGTAAAEDKGAVEQDYDAALASLMDSTASTGQVSSRGGLELGIMDRRKTGVLRSFTVYTAGNAVRVVDADGSIYEGTLQPLLAQAPFTLEARSDMPVLELVEGVAANDSTGVAAAAGEASPVSYRFLASGTNRTLRQSVVFEGELALTEQQLRSGRNIFSNTVPSTEGEGSERERMNASHGGGRLTGRAMLGESTDVPVDAVPITP